ncbi:Myb-like, SWIRM and MPN domain-containing protein 1 [Pycnococcus provasolii]
MASADMDPETAALIAAMQAEDAEYAAAYGGGGGGGYGGGFGDSDSDSSDYSGRSRKKSKKKKGKAGSSSGRRAPAKSTPKIVDEEGVERTASGRKKRKDAGGQMRQKPRAWTEEEEKKFLEALDMYGRDWHKCAEHMQTRESKAFTSHAQKHFIKLCLQGKPLPAKVAESGEGYTLSGKPLDPNSAAALAYGFKPDTQLTEGLAGVLSGGDANPGEGTSDAAAAAAAAAPAPAPAPAPVKPTKEKKRKAPEKQTAPPEPVEPTEYAKNRPKRENAGRKGYENMTSESLDLTRPRTFASIGKKAPYTVRISPRALLTMDAHAHCCTNEVIGYLGGMWDDENKELIVARAFPAKSISDAGTSCEMDPESEVAIKEAMEELGLCVVAWYHSHPIFKPIPSSKDIDNHNNIENLFSDENPVFATIVSPYDISLEAPTSAVNHFCLGKNVSKAGDGQMPMVVESTEMSWADCANVKPAGQAAMLGPPSIEELAEELAAVSDMYVSHPRRARLLEMWRPFCNLDVASKSTSGPPLTKLGKMRRSLAARLPDAEDAKAANLDAKYGDEVLETMFAHMQKTWKEDLGYA